MLGFRYGLTALAVSMSAPAMAVSIVTNGSFETGDFSGWTQFGNTSFTGVTGAGGVIVPLTGATAAFVPVDGTMQAFFGPQRLDGTLSQMLSTVEGQLYNYSFSLANGSGRSVNIFTARIGRMIVPPTGVNLDRQDYVTYSGFFTATSSLTNLNFTFRHDPNFFYLDAVSVSAVTGAVPEPATWAMMIGGFGVIGGTMRRRQRQTVRVSFG